MEVGLAAFTTALKGREDIGVAARVEEKTLAFTELDEIDACLEEVTAPGVREVTLDAQRKAGARSVRKGRDGIRGGQNMVGAAARIKGGVQQGIWRECVGPSENSGVLAKVALRVAADRLIVGDIRLLEIGTGAHQQQTHGVILSCAPVELRGGA